MAGEKGGRHGPPATSENPPSSPPPYSASPGACGMPDSGSRTSAARVPGLPALQFESYSTPFLSASNDRTTVSAYAAHLCSSPAALVSFVASQAALPPLPELRITGIHKNEYGHKCTDFDLRLSLLRYLVPEDRDDGQRWLNYTLIKQHGPDGVQAKAVGKEPTLQAWARAFCSDTSSMKSFTLTRSVTNWDTSLLSARVHALMATLQYKGNVTISFPVSYSKVVVAPPRSINNSFMASLFVSPRCYDVVEAIWPFATRPPPDGSEDHQFGRSERATAEFGGERRFAVQSEEGWWRDWEGALERAVLEGRQGWVGLDDLMEFKMGGPAPVRKVREWGANKAG